MYIFILSAGRSGSTLLDILIGQHEKIVSLGEIAHLPKNITLNTVCSCGEKVNECNFWQRIFLHLESKQVPIYSNPYSFSLGFPVASTVIDPLKQTKLYKLKRKASVSLQLFLLLILRGKIILKTFKEKAENSKLLFDEILTETNAEMVVDSSKEPLRAIIFYILNPHKTKIILLSRDGRGVLYSIQKQKDKLISGIIGWKKYYLKVFRLLKLVDRENLMVVKYDDVVGNFQETMSSIFNFLNVNEPNISPTNIVAQHHILNGNDMRLKKSFAIRFDDEWKSKLDENTKKIFKKIAGNMNSKLGYDIENKNLD